MSSCKPFVAIAYFGLLAWTVPAVAQSTYSLTVSRHPNIALSDLEADKILAGASKILKKETNHVSRPGDVACNVTFKRDGSVGTFASSNTPGTINGQADIDAVHDENAYVKVVEAINFCKGRYATFAGCSWPPEKRSMIVVHPGKLRRIVWAHEFGHTTGLWHRSDPLAVMTVCLLADDQLQVEQHECDCFRSGPASCITPQPPHPAQCSRRRSVSVQDTVRNVSVEHGPRELILEHAGSEIPALISMLHDLSDQDNWAEIATSLGFIGNGETGQVLLNFIESDVPGVNSSTLFRAKSAAIMALGYLLNRTNDAKIRDFLTAGAHSQAWERGGAWVGRTSEVRRTRIEDLQEVAMIAFALSGHSEAAQVLQSFAPSARKGNYRNQQFVEDLVRTHAQVRQRGLAAYYAGD